MSAYMRLTLYAVAHIKVLPRGLRSGCVFWLSGDDNRTVAHYLIA